ncbi:hypothetical protein [Streptomyces sp. 8N616]|uniref:hypothetical protein n=1 Tax=Streptomyces sp. 8N616 TaxID=3457414 RepID=UPI003FD21374
MQANLVYYLSDYLAMSPSLIAVVFAAQGAGAVLGAAACPWLARRFASRRAARAAVGAGRVGGA